MNPLFVPSLFLCEAIISICSGFTSGMTIGTSGVCLCAELFDTTGHSAFAYFSSRALISSFFISTAQNTKSTIEAIFSTSSSAFRTVSSPIASGRGSESFHLPATASLSFLPAERGEAATHTTLNHGCLSRSRENL